MNWKKKLIIIWSGQIFSLLSSSIVQFAVICWITLETRSASALAISGIAALLPQGLLGPFIGVFVDRWDRKSILMLSDIFVALCAAVMAALFYFGTVELWHLYLLLAFRSLGNAFYTPAMQASIPMLAPESQLTRIAGINQAIASVSVIAGPPLGAMFLAMMGMTSIMLMDIVGAMVGCLTVMRVRIPVPQKSLSSGGASVLKDLNIGLRAIGDNKGIMAMIAVSVVFVLVFMPLNAMFPLMTVQHFGKGILDMSFVEVAFGVGMLVGGAVLGVWPGPKKKIILLNSSYIVIGVTLLLSGLTPPGYFMFFVILTGIMGLSVPMYSGPEMALIQKYIEPDKLGRVFSLMGAMNILPAVAGLLATGVIAEVIGIANSFTIAGVITIALGVLSFFIKPIMRLE